jgi:hypothetical protein
MKKYIVLVLLLGLLLTVGVGNAFAGYYYMYVNCEHCGQQRYVQVVTSGQSPYYCVSWGYSCPNCTHTYSSSTVNQLCSFCGLAGSVLNTNTIYHNTWNGSKKVGTRVDCWRTCSKCHYYSYTVTYYP